jgi:hypothetical protein
VADAEEQWCSTSVWAGGRDGPGSFWNGSKAFRRQFFEAVQLNPKDPIATLIVARTVNGLLTLNLWL